MGDLISIIIPAYNIENYIGRCIESTISQSYSDIEIIVVNDGSMDGTGKICQKYADTDARVVYISQKNMGSVGARKTGLVKATGKYIIFADGDDYMDSNLVEKLYELIVKNDVDFVHSNYMIDGKNMNYINKIHMYTEKDLNFDFRVSLLKDYVFEWNFDKEIFECNLYGCIYQKKFIDDCYMPLSNQQQYGEDLLCFCNQIMKCKSMLMIPDAYYHYVQRDGSLCHSGDFDDALSNKISLYKELKSMLSNYGISQQLLEQCQLFFANKMLHDFGMITSERIKTKYKYICEFAHMLVGKKIVLYGAGDVGQSIYEQLIECQNIAIVGWVDLNFGKIHNKYRDITNPLSINSLQYDYIVIAIEREETAKQIINYLSNMNINKDLILWKPYKKEITVSLQ